MPKMSTQTQARPLFDARLTPHRSLGRRGMRIVVAIIAVLASVPGIVMFSMGAWPVVGFMGLDVLLVWWALSSSLKDGKRYEQITLWRDQLEFKQVDGNGREQLTRFSPRAVRLVIDRDYNERTTGLHLRTDERDLTVGTFLDQGEKASFAKAFGSALKRARQSA